MRERLDGGLAGILAGLIATGVMSIAMLAGKRMGLTGELPPERIGREAIDKLSGSPSEESENTLAMLLHFAFGAGAGAILGALLGCRVPVTVRVPVGVAYATGVWAVSYLGWIPALGLLPPATRDRPGRSWVMLAAHWLYGTVAAVVQPYAARRLGTSRCR